MLIAEHLGFLLNYAVPAVLPVFKCYTSKTRNEKNPYYLKSFWIFSFMLHVFLSEFFSIWSSGVSRILILTSSPAATQDHVYSLKKINLCLCVYVTYVNATCVHVPIEARKRYLIPSVVVQLRMIPVDSLVLMLSSQFVEQFGKD